MLLLVQRCRKEEEKPVRPRNTGADEEDFGLEGGPEVAERLEDDL